MATKHKIASSLWFDNQAEEAARYYTSIFKNSSIGRITKYPDEGYEIHHGKAGSVLTVEFELEGQPYIALNGGPEFKFSEAISFIIYCETQDEIDYYWEKLSAGGDPNAQQCGWLKDKFGLSWQVVPTILDEYLADEDEEKAKRVMHVMLQMKKLDIAELNNAYQGSVTADV